MEIFNMIRGSSIVVGIGLVLSCTGCTSQVVTATAGSGSGSAGGAPSDGTYVLDFTRCKLGGLNFGSNVDILFSFDLQTATRSYAIQEINQQYGPGLVARDETPSDVCPILPLGPPQWNHKQVLDLLGTEDTANVLSVDLELTAYDTLPKDAPVRYCFGYRDTGGGWHATDTIALRVYDPQTDRFHVTLPIAQGPITGLYIVTESVSTSVQTLTYHIKT